MSPDRIRKNLRLAQSTGLSPIDLWGGEWWYWRAVVHHDPTTWEAVQNSLRD